MEKAQSRDCVGQDRHRLGRQGRLVESEKDEKHEGGEVQVCHFRSELSEAFY